jgi:hypothetical protein
VRLPTPTLPGGAVVESPGPRTALWSATYEARKGRIRSRWLTDIWVEWPEGGTTGAVVPYGPSSRAARLVQVPDQQLSPESAQLIANQVCSQPIHVGADGTLSWEPATHCVAGFDYLAGLMLPWVQIDPMERQGVPWASDEILIWVADDQGHVTADLWMAPGRHGWASTHSNAPSLRSVSVADPELAEPVHDTLICSMRALVDPDGRVDRVLSESLDADLCPPHAQDAASQALGAWTYDAPGEPASQAVYFRWDPGERQGRALLGPQVSQPWNTRTRKPRMPAVPAPNERRDGTCWVVVRVDRRGRGTLEDATCDPVYLDQAREVLPRWRFIPAFVDGVPVTALWTVQMQFVWVD